MISDTLEIMALLDVHDTVDIKDFSQLTCLYRFTKEIRKQEWTAVQSSYISRGSPPRKQEPCVFSDVKLAIPSAYPEERLRDGEAHGGGQGGAHGAHGTHPESQHDNPKETWELKKMWVLKEANEAREVEEVSEAKEAKKARKAKRKANKANEAREARKAKKKANKANKANKAKRV
jgi:hypothetical protein